MSTFNLFIKYDRTYVIQVNNTIKFNNLCNIISKKINVPKKYFYIQFGGKILDNIDRIRLNPSIQEINDNSKTNLTLIKPDSTFYIMIYSHGPSFIKKLYEFIIENNYTIDEFEKVDTYGLELSKFKFTLSKQWSNT